LAVSEPERDVPAGSVAVAEEDEIARPVPAGGRIGTYAAGNLGRVGGRVGAGQEAIGRPLRRGGEAGIDPGLSDCPPHVHRAVTGGARRLARPHLFDSPAAVGGEAEVVAVAADV